LSDAADHLRFADGRLDFAGVKVNAYLASVTADFLRQKLLEQKVSFTFETVMSSPDKVEILKKAQGLGYRTYLYYIATDDPEINISRVRNRVAMGFHPVPEDKIVSRYKRSLDLLMEAVRHTNRAYIFDNSAHNQADTWLAEITDGRVLEMKTDRMPAWFKRAIWDKITPSGK
jgi:predicted ABC-type ATPase